MGLHYFMLVQFRKEKKNMFSYKYNRVSVRNRKEQNRTEQNKTHTYNDT